MTLKETPIFKKLVEWEREYGRSGSVDERAVHEFMDCETREAVRALQSELGAIAHGHYCEDTLKYILGPNRKARHGSYDVWAKAMLMWMSGHKE